MDGRKQPEKDQVKRDGIKDGWNAVRRDEGQGKKVKGSNKGMKVAKNKEEWNQKWMECSKERWMAKK